MESLNEMPAFAAKNLSNTVPIGQWNKKSTYDARDRTDSPLMSPDRASRTNKLINNTPLTHLNVNQELATPVGP